MRFTKKIFMGMVMIGCCSFPLLGQQASARDKVIVAVGDFWDQSGRGLGPKTTELITNTFIELKYFEVVERSRMDQIYKELSFQQSSMIDDQTAAGIGKQIGATLVVVGSISNATYNAVRNEHEDKNGNKFYTYCGSAEVNLNIRIVDIATSKILMSESIKGAYSEVPKKDSNSLEPKSAVINIALERATHNIYRPIQEKFPLAGYVLKIEGQIIWVDFGSDCGIKPLRKLTIYREGEPMTHPKTGEVIPNREKLGSDRVAEAQAETCTVKLSKKEAAQVQVGDLVIAEPEGSILRDL